jgi:glyoxylase-like metal-dependent hydrolase (beta-lactamase superfamily II)
VRGGLVCHVLLVETDAGLVLVDSGFGLRDIADPATRVGPVRHLVRPALDPDETAVHQVRALGHAPQDVRHIVLTHFDGDHAGGLADFPDAHVHVTGAEATAVRNPSNRMERARYRPSVRGHGMTLVPHTPRDSEAWRGFPAATELAEIAAGLVLIGLPGHSRGHAAVAVDAGERWVLHVGDAFYGHAQLTGGAKGLAAAEMLVAHDRRQVRANHARLRELWTSPEPDLLLVNAHDPALLRAARSA